MHAVAGKVLAVPVIPGCKSPSERFAGADETYTIEALMQNGWALQVKKKKSLRERYTSSLRPHTLVADGLIREELEAAYASSLRPHTLVA